MEKMQIFVPDGNDRTVTVEAKVYRHIAEIFETALPALERIGVNEVQSYRELTSPLVVLEHFRVQGAQKIYKGTVAEWRCDIEAPVEVMQRLKAAQEVID